MNISSGQIPNFGTILSEILNFCIKESENRKKYFKASLISDYLNSAYRELFLENIEKGYDFETSFYSLEFLVIEALIDIGLLNREKNSKLSVSIISTIFENNNQITYSEFLKLEKYNHFILYRMSEAVINYFYNKEKAEIDINRSSDIENFNKIFYKNRDISLNSLSKDILERVKNYGIQQTKNDFKSISLLENLDFDFQLTRQDSPYHLKNLEPIYIPKDIDKIKKKDNRSINELILEKIKNLTPQQFELFSLEIIAEISEVSNLDKNNKDFIQHSGSTGDGGIDGIIMVKNKFGRFEENYIQCKRYSEKSVGRPELQAFVGALDSHKPDRGIFITTSKFTSHARAYITTLKTKKVELMDGLELVQYMLDQKIGVKHIPQDPIITIDEDFFKKFYA